MKYSEPIQEFLSFLRDCVQDFNIAQEEEATANSETQDILHKLELCENNYHDMAKIAKALTEVRRRRRNARDKALEGKYGEG